ncbi:hAT family dimerization protein [Ceratobasidium sp. AG-Ba]|nr:hAT family dimerization protein [Ceratobasidium sp. AG-Ba]QRV99484.1 hAT family dimerization protein [Ceratobasidium sp. AG-Ba]QRW13994.1 hAT family dimerization protein [Ceratobasidium sp. AG-Ba]
MDHVLSMFADVEASKIDPIHSFVHTTSVFNVVGGKQAVFNPLAWWSAQHAAGNKEHGLTQMALDILSMPAWSIDVQCMFLFAGSIMSKHCHNVAPYTVQVTALLGSHLKAGLVKLGTLLLPPRGKEAGKGKVAVQASNSEGT